MIKPIFNSLGSNYDFRFVFISLGQLFGFRPTSERVLKENIAQFWNLHSNQVRFTYKGRDAIELALKSYNIGKGSEVITQAFSCFAIEEAIMRSGAKPIYVDLAQNSLNPSVNSLEKAYKKSKNAKAVLIQHILGCPADIKKIKKWAAKKNLLLIEDLAQSLGARDSDGKLLGSLGDALILSFGRDKIVDGVSGGAVVFKEKPKKEISLSQKVPFYLVFKDLIYPSITWKVRFFYEWGVGKIIHKLAVWFKFIDSPTKRSTKQLSALPQKYMAGILYQLRNLNKELEHRREIAQFYKNNLRSLTELKILTKEKSIKNGSNLRFAISVKNPQKLAKYLTTQKIYLADRWYRDPVDCGKLNCASVYLAKTCSQAEKLTETIFNLPTHKHISISEANRIVKAIKNWSNN